MERPHRTVHQRDQRNQRNDNRHRQLTPKKKEYLA
jgi:hypothetical protein